MQPRTVRLPQRLWDALDRAAEREHRSTNGQLLHLIAAWEQGGSPGARDSAPAPKARSFEKEAHTSNPKWSRMWDAT